MIIKATNLDTGIVSEWNIPSKDAAIKNSEKTWGERYDKIEREVVKGGIPLKFNRVVSI